MNGLFVKSNEYIEWDCVRNRIFVTKITTTTQVTKTTEKAWNREDD